MTRMAPPNWYNDPESSHRLRYWDGAAWTSHYADMPPVPAGLPEPAPVDADEHQVSLSAVPVASSRRQLRAGELLIGLGAFALVAAGFAFMRDIWSGLGLVGQVAVLLAIVFAQAAGSMFAVPRIRGLGEALAGSAAVTLFLTSSWGYSRIGGPDLYFPLLAYMCALAHALVLFAPLSNRARAWHYSFSAFVFVGAYLLLAVPQPHLWAFGLTVGGLLCARFAFPQIAERFAAVHVLFALVYIFSSFEDFESLGAGFVGGYTAAALVTLFGVAASQFFRTSVSTEFFKDFYSAGSDKPIRCWDLRSVVWLPSICMLGLLAVYGLSDAAPSLSQRLVFVGVGAVAAVLVLAFSPEEFSKYRKWVAAGVGVLALAQLGYDYVFAPSVRFIEDVLETIGAWYAAIGAGYLLFGAGVVILCVSAWKRASGGAFFGAGVSSLGWWVLLDTRLNGSFEWASYPELFTIPVSFLLLAAACVSSRTQVGSSRPFLPAMLIVLVPATAVSLSPSVTAGRFSILVAACLCCLPIGFRFRLQVLVVPPALALLLIFMYRVRELLDDSWVTLFIAALVLLVLGSLFEKMRDRVRAARTYISNLR